MKMKRKTTFQILLAVVLIVSVTGVVNATTGEYYSALMARPTPYCNITNPSDGETVTGTVTITVSALRRPYIYIDGVEVAKGTSYNWDTTGYSNGLHDIEAVIRGASDLITVNVDNGVVDDPPIVTIVSPSDGSTVSGTTTIMVSVTDEEVLIPDIYIDGVFIITASSYDWDTTTYSDGLHTIYAEATDSASQTGTDEISVTVDNSSPQPDDLPWWNDLIDAEIAHANGITGDGSVVVIIDTGLGTNWPTLFPSTNILTDYCWSQTKSLGIDNVDWNQDTEGHGTACTATVIGYDLNGQWVRGVAPDAKIVMIRTVYWIGGGVTDTTMLNAWADAIDYARSLHNGALSGYDMVISMSLGYTGTNTNLANAIDAAEADGIILATSAGNDGHASDTTGYPAEYADVTSVGAAGWDSLTGAYGIDGIFTDIAEGDFSELHIADFSSGGKVDVTGIGEQLVLPYTDGYYYTSGTSFSCPQTAGVYALMFQAHGSQSVQWMESYLQSTCYWNGAYMTSFVWGAGFIQADAATS
jgi:subtilisin